MLNSFKDWIAEHPEGVVGFFIGLITGGALASIGYHIVGLSA